MTTTHDHAEGIVDHGDHTHDGAGAADPHAPIENTAEEPDYFDVLQQAIRELLVEKGLISADEVRAMVETLDAHGPALGSALVARAWTDPDFKERLLADGTAAIEEFGIDNYDGTNYGSAMPWDLAVITLAEDAGNQLGWLGFRVDDASERRS